MTGRLDDFIIPTARLPDALHTLQMLATVAHDRICVVEGAAPRAVIADETRAGLLAQAAELEAQAARIRAALAAAESSHTADTLEAA